MKTKKDFLALLIIILLISAWILPFNYGLFSAMAKQVDTPGTNQEVISFQNALNEHYKGEHKLRYEKVYIMDAIRVGDNNEVIAAYVNIPHAKFVHDYSRRKTTYQLTDVVFYNTVKEEFWNYGEMRHDPEALDFYQKYESERDFDKTFGHKLYDGFVKILIFLAVIVGVIYWFFTTKEMLFGKFKKQKKDEKTDES